MAIVIPSKNIYSINFDPVIDNNIDKVEVNSKDISIIVDPNFQYTEEIKTDIEASTPYTKINGETEYKNNNKNHDDGSVQTIQGTNLVTKYVRLLAFSEMRLGYLTIPIKIYANSIKGEIIQLLYTGEIDGSPTIDYTSQFAVAEFRCKGLWKYKSNSAVYPENADVTVERGEVASYNTKRGKIIEYENPDAADNNVTYNRETKKIEYKFSYSRTYNHSSNNEIVAGNATTLTVNTSITMDDKTSDLKKLTISTGSDSKGKYFQTNITLLVSRQIITLLESGNFLYNSLAGLSDAEMSGSLYGAIANTIYITFNGQTVKLNIGEILKIYGNKIGKNVISFETNELIQNTNNNQLLYEELVNKWKNGKQTAIITCPVADFYDTNDNKVIDTNVSGKMMFNMGDIVIPYTYTNQGDKPIAYNKDFTPKQFKVVGTKISKNQGGTQELTLQEV